MSKYTNGTEFVLANQKPYKGIYCIKSKGNYYTGKTFVYGVSKKMFPAEKIKTTSELTHELIIEYNDLNTPYSKKDFINLESYFPTPTNEDYEKKRIITRYFAQKVNNKKSTIVEIDVKQFKKKNKYYNYVSLNWKISGSNIDSYNKEQVDIAKETLPGIEIVLSNLTQLSLRSKSDI